MGELNLEFGRRLREGVWSVAKRRGIKKSESVDLVATESFIGPASLNGWEQGRVPKNFDPDDVERLAQCLIRLGRLNIAWASSFLTQARYHGSSKYASREAFLAALFPQQTLVRPNIFIACQSDIPADIKLGLRLQTALNLDCGKVFLDDATTIDTKWAERIISHLQQTSFLIALLSSESAGREIVPAMIEMAFNTPNVDGEAIRVLPVRVAYRRPFTDKLRAYLDPLEWAVWESEEDTPALIETLRLALKGGALPLDREARERFLEPDDALDPTKARPPATSRWLVTPDGLDSASFFYVERDNDRKAISEIRRRDAGVTLVIKGPRQMGKSSLLLRVIQEAQKVGKQVGVIDPHLLRSALNDADVFYPEFCISIAEAFDLANGTEQLWARVGETPNPRLCSRYMQQHVLSSVDDPLVLVLEEAEFFFNSPFRTEFFGMLRSWHNSRTKAAWRKLDLIIVTSTEPYFFIDDLNQSPFNVGAQLIMADFGVEEVNELNRRHGYPLTPEEVAHLMALVGGHPYLVRMALFLVTDGRWTAEQLFTRARDKNGPFADHLRALLLLCLSGKRELIDGLRRVLAGERIDDRETLWRLTGSGLVGIDDGVPVIRNVLYGDFFRRYFRD